MIRLVQSIFAGFAVTTALTIAPADAEVITIKADLKGASEVPPTLSQGIGNVTTTYDTVSKKLSWKGTVSGLTGNATAAHFQGPAETGKNAGVLMQVSGVTTGPFEGSATLTDDQAKALIAGQTDFNIYTAANPNGEVRGQVMEIP